MIVFTIYKYNFNFKIKGVHNYMQWRTPLELKPRPKVTKVLNPKPKVSSSFSFPIKYDYTSSVS